MSDLMHVVGVKNFEAQAHKLNYGRCVLRLGCDTDDAPECMQLTEKEWARLAAVLREEERPGLVRLAQYAAYAAAWMRRQAP